MSKGWIGVDLDGTLAHYDGWKGERHIGEPIKAMWHRVMEWTMQGREVRIFTARVSEVADRPADISPAVIATIIQDWLEKHGLPRLQVTNVKDYAMIELWDDRAVQVIPNTGRRADGNKHADCL